MAVRPLCDFLGRTEFHTRSCEAERENFMAVLYLFKTQKGLSVNVRDGASVDCP